MIWRRSLPKPNRPTVRPWLDTAAPGDITGTLSATLGALAATATGEVDIAGGGAATLGTLTLQRDYALRFHGNGADVNRVRIQLDNPSDPPIDVGADDFAYEFWMRAAYADNDTTALDEDARYSNIILDRDIWGHVRGWVLGVTRDGANLVTCFGVAGSGLAWNTIYGSAHVGDNEWHHIALTRSGSTVRVFVDGGQDASGTYSGDLSYPNGETGGGGQDNPYLVIGCEKHDVGYYYTGDVDELRVSNVARYTSGFTPVRRHTLDGDTVAMLRFDEGSGTIAYDTSGLAGAEHGELLVGGSPSGPEWIVVPDGYVVTVAEITGTLSATLGAVTAAASGDVDIAGVGAATLGALTATATGDVDIAGTLATTLGALTATATGEVDIEGTTSVTLGALTVTATGTVADGILGTLAVTLGALTAAATGDVDITGTASVTLGAASVAATGEVDIAGSLSVTLGALTVAGTGTIGEVITGTLTVTLGTLTATATGDVDIEGTLATTLGALTGAGAGSVVVVGVASVTLGGMTSTATGTVAIVGTGAPTLSALTLAGSGVLGDYLIPTIFATIIGMRAGGRVRSMQTDGAIVGMRSTAEVD